MAVKHTPTPWRVELSPGRRTLCILSSDAWICGELSNGNGEQAGEGEANAAFIVRAVNAHDDLVAALKEAAEELYHISHPSGDPSDPSNMDSVAMAYRTVTAALDKAEAL